ncbi:MAG: DUF4388 domain-containing protein [bacterium]|nr:DUF4388 domain-containing protein [bacterium]
MELSGRLAVFPIAELLQWAHNDRRTGSLVVRRSTREKRIYFDVGRIVACFTDAPAEFYGQHLLLNGYLDQPTLFHCLSLCRKKSKRLGEVLEDEGILELGDVQRTLRYQIEDVICDLFLWNHGVFYFRSESPPPEEILAEPIATVGLVLEGTRWVDEVARIREVFVHDSVVLGPVTGKLLDDVKPRQRRILQEVDGHRSLAQLYDAVRGSYYRFLYAAFELQQAGVVEVLDVGEKYHPMSSELSLYDLLFEQAAEEQIRSSRRHFTHPIGSFERFVPVWVRPPDSGEWSRMPERVREFYRKFDGTRRLVKIFSTEEEEWNREAELLMLQIGKEAVALLPASLADLEAAAARRDTPESQRWWKRIFDKQDS